MRAVCRTKSVLLREVNAFNRSYPPGTAVIVSTTTGERQNSIRQKAFIWDGMIAMACLMDSPFYASIDHIRPLKPPPTEGGYR